MKKIFLMNFFGEYPYWMDRWVANMENLDYDYKIFSNLKRFKERVGDILGIEPPIVRGKSKAWDYGPAMGLLYEDIIEGYDCWGHTDFDCVYGDVDKYMPKEFDIWSNHHSYICGPWTLYKNNPKINSLFKLFVDWKKIMKTPNITAWSESYFSQVAHLECNLVYTFHQTKSQDDFSGLEYKDGKLYDGGDEVMMAHFRHTKIYPPQIIF